MSIQTFHLKSIQQIGTPLALRLKRLGLSKTTNSLGIHRTAEDHWYRICNLNARISGKLFVMFASIFLAFLVSTAKA